MFIRLGEVCAASETAEISKLRRIYQEYLIVAFAVEELGINLLPFQIDSLACVCCWLSSSSLVSHVSLMGHTDTVKCYSLVVSALSVRVSVPLVCYTCLRLLFPFLVCP